MEPIKELINFGAYLTGHDQSTIEQMYSDWRAPKRKPILITEDGFYLFEGDKVYMLGKEHLNHIGITTIQPRQSKLFSGIYYFSSFDAAKKYRLNNVQKLSVSDVIEAFELSETSPVANRLRKIVKSRL